MARVLPGETERPGAQYVCMYSVIRTDFGACRTGPNFQISTRPQIPAILHNVPNSSSPPCLFCHCSRPPFPIRYPRNLTPPPPLLSCPKPSPRLGADSQVPGKRDQSSLAANLIRPLGTNIPRYQRSRRLLIMAASPVQNPQAPAESKSAKKKKAKAERTESPAPILEKAASVSPNDGSLEDASESPYVRELAK